MAIGVGKLAVQAAESEEGQAAIKKAGEVASKAGAATLKAGKASVGFTSSTAQRTYQGLAGFSGSKALAEEAQGRYGAAEADFQTHVQAAQQRLATYEHNQQLILTTTVARFVEIWLRHKDQLQNSAVDLRVELNLTPREMAAFKATQIQSLEVAGGLGVAAIAGASAGTAAITAATALGTASTGAAISGLGGAAAHSAMLAWFGGGSLAAGGGGMALGATVLGGIFVAPAVLVGAMAAARKGEQRLTQATEYAAQVDAAIAEMGLRITGFNAVARRLDELQDVTDRLNGRLLGQVHHCEQLERENKVTGEHKAGFVKAMFDAAVLAKALKDVLKVPVVDEHFQVTDASKTAIGESRQTLGERV